MKFGRHIDLDFDGEFYGDEQAPSVASMMFAGASWLKPSAEELAEMGEGAGDE
jgi:hypothetical protein